MNSNSVEPNDPATNAHVDVQDDHFQVVREIGAASTVLLKNVAGIAFAGEYHLLSLWTPGADVRRSISKRARTL